MGVGCGDRSWNVAGSASSPPPPPPGVRGAHSKFGGCDIQLAGLRSVERPLTRPIGSLPAPTRDAVRCNDARAGDCDALRRLVVTTLMCFFPIYLSSEVEHGLNRCNILCIQRTASAIPGPSGLREPYRITHSTKSAIGAGKRDKLCRRSHLANFIAERGG